MLWAKKGIIYNVEAKKNIGPKVEDLLNYEGIDRIIKFLDVLKDGKFLPPNEISAIFKKLKIEQTPSVFVFKPNQSFIGKMQIEELPNMLEPFFAEFEDSTKTEVSLKPIFSSKNILLFGINWFYKKYRYWF